MTDRFAYAKLSVMTKTKAEPSPAEESPLTVEMRKGDKFVSVTIEDEKNLRDPHYALDLINSLSSDMAAEGAIWPPLTTERLRELALNYAQRIIYGEGMSPDQAVREYGISWDEANEVATLASTATVVIV